MGEISRVALFGKLNSLAYKAIEGATVLCKLRGNPYVELEHWVQQILQEQDSDWHRIARHFELDASRLAADITAALDQLPRGSSSISDLSVHIENAVERAWVYATLMFGEAQVRSGHLVVGMLKTPSLRNVLLRISAQFERIKPETLADNFGAIVAGSPEEHLRATDGSGVGAVPGQASGAMAPAQLGKQEALQRFAVDLTERARKGEIDPVTGRDEEVRQIVDILMRRRQNNPILTGEAGVGKTAVVEGFAARIASGDVPPPLRDVSLLMLDIGLLQAGASMKGEFENRLRQVIDEVQASLKPVILFIDEAHTLIGAGGAAGTGDAANLLKPALARGTLRTIGATTWAEYKKYIEKDPALTRRFQVIQVEEPDEDKAIRMVRGLAGALEKHHRIQVLDEAIDAAVRLSRRYIPSRQLPDKAISLLDTSCARVRSASMGRPLAWRTANGVSRRSKRNWKSSAAKRRLDSRPMNGAGPRSSKRKRSVAAWAPWKPAGIRRKTWWSRSLACGASCGPQAWRWMERRATRARTTTSVQLRWTNCMGCNGNWLACRAKPRSSCPLWMHRPWRRWSRTGLVFPLGAW